jgi:SAM-dependent methyltransferase
MMILDRFQQKIKNIRQFSKFKKQFIQFKSLCDSTRFPVNWEDRYPRLEDNTGITFFDRHYIYHTAWAARVLARTMPSEHIDISSSLYFAGIVSAFVPIKFYDYRPPALKLHGLSVDHVDILSLPFPDDSIPSISCLHVVEHIGLGRYGDTIDPEGDLKAISEIRRVTSIGGDILFAAPVGNPKVMFNAHRIYSYEHVLNFFQGFRLIEFALVPDESQDSGLIEGVDIDLVNRQKYGCGCFWFKK